MREPRPAKRPGLFLARAILAGLCLGVLLAAPAAADGLVVETRTTGAAGLQVDGAALSPRSPRPAATAAAGTQTYEVQAGDTLSGIAARLGVDAAALAALNGVSDPDRIGVGQRLVIGAGSSRPLSIPVDGKVDRLQFWPWPPAQGQTLVLWVSASEPVTYTLAFDGRPYPVQPAVEGSRAWALVPIPPLEEPGDKQFVLQAGDQTISLRLPVQAGAFPSSNIPASTSDAILSDTQKVQTEAARMTEIFGGYTAASWNGRSRFDPPLEGDPPRTAPYGSRRTYGGSSAVSAHAGEDFSALPGTPVYAPADAVVVLAEPLFVRGNAVVLDHGGGVYTGYWHLSEIDVEAGQPVSTGDSLGKVGSTGLSTGAHLHWEMRIAGMAVDPLQWLE